VVPETRRHILGTQCEHAGYVEYSVREGLAMTQAFEMLLYGDDGQGLVEYAFILALVALVAIGAVSILGITIRTLFEGPLPVLE
jgi:Flp pilus assembly pilin Flp